MRESSICNGESKLFACLPGHGIKINSAFYGKQYGQDCNGDLPYKDETPSCSALDALANVEDQCSDKQTCLLQADENIYGKALCPNVNKYLRIEYFCRPLPHHHNVTNESVKGSENGAERSTLLRPVEEGIDKLFQSMKILFTASLTPLESKQRGATNLERDCWRTRTQTQYSTNNITRNRVKMMHAEEILNSFTTVILD